ncbi:F-box/kelch-repeat protein At3g06240-like [Apium graveolens]|uniref:F-box/kelch-repeat protein At3g06240-like n=1 Tax=Apium graveolens TaxID=4045 RepID=UPI003D7BCA2D
MSNYGPPDIRQRPGCLTNLSGNSGLPAEMMDLILLRLPVKYLLRCRAVSKPWCIIIDSLSFLKRHLQRSIDCCHDTAAVFKHPCEAPSHLAVFYVADVGSLYDTKFKPKPKSHEDITALPVVGEASPGQASQGQASQGAASRKRKVRKGKSRKGKDPVVEPVSCYLADDDSVCELVSVDMNKIFEFGLSEPQLVGSCNGLVCVWNQHHKYGSSIYIWNPATRKSRRLPKHVNCRHVPFPHLLLGSSIVGFGYDSLHHDYKVVTSIDSNYFGRNFGVLLMSVFSLSGSSWRRIQPITNDYHIDVQKFGTYANGSVFWLARKDPNLTNLIFAFDLGAETHRALVSCWCF